jgi:hypothetical protein
LVCTVLHSLHIPHNMPQINNVDADLLKKGYYPFLYDSMRSMASKRKEGYMEACEGRAIRRDGVLYIKNSDIKFIMENFPLSEEEQLKAARMTEIMTVVSKTSDFLEGKTPCDFQGCEELKKAYEAELAAMGGPACSNCTKEKIKAKYADLALQLKEKQAK